MREFLFWFSMFCLRIAQGKNFSSMLEKTSSHLRAPRVSGVLHEHMMQKKQSNVQGRFLQQVNNVVLNAAKPDHRGEKILVVFLLAFGQIRTWHLEDISCKPALGHGYQNFNVFPTFLALIARLHFERSFANWKSLPRKIRKLNKAKCTFFRCHELIAKNQNTCSVHLIYNSGRSRERTILKPPGYH